MRLPAAALATGVTAWALAAACSNPLGPQYEYEEQVYLQVDGSATVVVDSSIPALVALRGAALDPSPERPVDRDEVRRLFESAGCPVANVGRPWRRHSRRFVSVRMETADIRTLSQCGLLSWSTFALEAIETGLRYRQVVGAATPRDPGPVNWDGSELVGFKLHLPSRITHHNVKILATGENGTVERGNILTWEQRLADRRAGTPIEMVAEMEGTSILYTTLWMFAGAIAGAAGVVALLVWLTIRRGRAAAKNFEGPRASL